MDLFRDKEHDQRHDDTEQQIRALAEQVAQLTIELGEARADINRLQAEKLDAPDPEALDDDIADAKAKLAAAKDASSDAWNDVYPQLVTSLGKVRDAIDAAGNDPEKGPDEG